MRISETQRKILVLLNAEPKTIEDLKNQLDFGFDVLTKEMNQMIKLGIVKKTDEFPTKYCLDEYIVKELQKRKEVAQKDSFRLKIQMIIDLEGIVGDVVKLHLNRMKALLEKESNITIYKSKISDVLEQDSAYFGYIDVVCTVKDFRSLLHLIMYYTPSSIEVLSPKRFDVSTYELQDGLIELAQRTQMYARELNKRLTKEESERILKNLARPA